MTFSDSKIKLPLDGIFTQQQLYQKLLESDNYNYYTRLTTSFLGQAGQAGTRKVKPVWIEIRRKLMGFWDAVRSAGPYANNLHLAPDR